MLLFYPRTRASNRHKVLRPDSHDRAIDYAVFINANVFSIVTLPYIKIRVMSKYSAVSG